MATIASSPSRSGGRSSRRRRSAPADAPRTALATAALALLLLLTLAGPVAQDVGILGEGPVLIMSQVRQLGYLLILAAGIVAARPLRHPERLLVVPWPLATALAWCWFSMTWSVEPGTTLRGLVLTSIALWSVFLLVRQLGYDRTLLVLRAALAAAMVVNVAVALFLPDIGFHPETPDDLTGDLSGGLRGFMAHKNVAGLATALTVIAFAFDHRRLPRALGWGFAVAAAVVLVLTKSKTSIGICVAAVAIGFLFRHGAPRLNHALGRLPLSGRLLLNALWLLPAALLVYLTVDIAVPLGWTQDPAAFTGRTQIWQPMLLAYAEAPWTGYGFNAFWSGEASPVRAFTRATWVWNVAEGHNGFLDLLVQIGLPGLLLVLLACLVWPARRLVRDADRSGPAGALLAAVLVFCLGHNGTESSLFLRDTIGEVLLMLALAMLWATASAGGVATRRRSPASPAPTPSRIPRISRPSGD